jgi:3-isopropylmalate/(R)-2-methylmalate dehydratase large subunit
VTVASASARPDQRTLVDKLWDAHVVAHLGDGLDLVHVDRHLLHDLSGAAALGALRGRGLHTRNPELAFATPDHGVSTAPGRDETTSPIGARLVPALRAGCRAEGIRLFDLADPEQGIVHVVGPELGLTLPGASIVCGDSHTCTHGGLGALAWGIGSSEIVHVLATQTLIEERPRTLRIDCRGALAEGVEAKDLVLHAIGRLGADAGSGFAVEYAGPAVTALGVEGRMTLCNLAVELGAKIGLVAPDDTTFEYLEGRPYAPREADWERALAHWRTLRSDPDATFDRDVPLDAGDVAPQITWGTSPEHTMPVDGRVPDPRDAPNSSARDAWSDALAYMDLQPGDRVAGLPIARVFIGSCANGRLSDLEAAARVARGRRVAAGVEAWVVPGSRAVMREAEARGLAALFVEAGFQWREPGCSVCSATNGELVAPGARCVSTTNRNFVGRQGPGARTHLASPAMAAAAAVAGRITDVRRLA